MARRRGRGPEARSISTGAKGSKGLIVYFPALGADAVDTYQVMSPMLPDLWSLTLSYPTGGYDEGEFFAYLDWVIKRVGGLSGLVKPPSQLILVGVSFGAGVAMRYRLHQMSMAKEAKRRLRPAKLLLYSPVAAGSDLKARIRWLGLVAKVVRGGAVSQFAWNRWRASRLLYPRTDGPGADETSAAVLEARKAGLDAYPLALLSSGLRTMRTWPVIGAGAMGEDTALIFGFHEDDVLKAPALERTAAAFRSASVVRLATTGHADMLHVTSVIARMADPIREFLAGAPDTPDPR